MWINCFVSIQSGIDTELTTEDEGQTALLIACTYASIDALKLLIDRELLLIIEQDDKTWFAQPMNIYYCLTDTIFHCNTDLFFKMYSQTCLNGYLC